MIKLLVHDAAGAVTQRYTIDAEINMPEIPEGLFGAIYDGPEGVEAIETAIEDGEIIFRPRTILLVEAQAALWEQVKAIRERRINWGVTVPGIGRFDSSQEARDNVAGAAGAALTAIVMGTPEAFSAEWTLADNTSRTMTAQEMVQVQLAGVAYIDAVHARARALRVLIDAATTLAELEAVPIESGWPE